MKLRDFFILFVALAFGIFVSYGLQMNSRHDPPEGKRTLQGGRYPGVRPDGSCETYFLSGFPFIFYSASAVNLNIEYPLWKERLPIDPCNEILPSKINWTLFIIDVAIVGFLIFLAIALPDFIFSRILHFSWKRLIFSILIGILWALFAMGMAAAYVFGGTPSAIMYYSLGLPLALSFLVWDLLRFTFSLDWSFGDKFFILVLPSVIAPLLVYLATELFVRRSRRA